MIIDNRYEINKVLKSNSKGCIYKAYDPQLDSTLVIKKLIPIGDEKSKSQDQQDFWEEARLLSLMDYKGFPKLNDFFVSKDPESSGVAYYMAISYIDGVDLKTYLKKPGRLPLSVKEALSYFQQILFALIYLCSQKPPIIYNNIKPSNVMIKKGHIFLTDFGIAQTYTPGKKFFGKKGTMGYISLEQYKGYSEPRSDLFSLGALTHYLLTGVNPEESDEPFKFEPIREYNPKVPKYIEKIIMSMLSVKPEKRPLSARQVVKALKAYGELLKKQKAQNAKLNAHLTEKPKGKKASIKDNLTELNINDKIFSAIKKNDYTKLRKLKDKGINVNIRDVFQWTPLHRAASRNLEEMTALLIEMGADVNAVDSSNWSPLHRAAGKGSLKSALILIENGANVNAQDKYNWTPLHKAAEAGYQNMVNLLISKGANLSIEDKDGCTPIFRAVTFNRKETLEIFLDRGIDVNSKNRYGWTPLHEAASLNLKEISALLIKRGADIGAKSKKGLTPMQIAKMKQSEDVIELFESI